MKPPFSFAIFGLLLVFGTAASTLAQYPSFSASPFTFDPDGVGGVSAKWLKGIGEPDYNCRTNFGLRLEKSFPAFISAGVELKGLAGYVVDGSESIGFDYKTDATTNCSGGSPRFNIEFTRPDGTAGLSFVGGCGSSVNVPSLQSPGWTRVTAGLSPQDAGGVPSGSVIRSVVLMVDEPGRYVLDNVMFRYVYADKQDASGQAPTCPF